MTEHRTIDQIFQTCLDMMLKEHYTIDQVLDRFPELADELRPQLEALIWLREKGKALDPRSEFITASRQRIVQQAQKEPIAVQSSFQAQEPFWRRISFGFVWQAGAALLVLLVLIFIGNRAIIATRNAIPGEALYPLKLFVEKAQIALAPNDYRATQLHIEFSLRRQSEIEELVMEGRYDLLPDAVQKYQNEVNLAIQSLDRLASSDPSGAQELALTLNQALSSQLVSLAVLSDLAPPEFKTQFDQMMQFNMSSSSQVDALLEEVIKPALPTATSPGVISSPTSTPANPTANLVPFPSNTPLPSPTATNVNVQPVGTYVYRLTFTPTITPTSTTTPTPTPRFDVGKPNTKTPTPTPTNTKKPPNTHKPPTHTPRTDTPPNPPKGTPGPPSNPEATPVKPTKKTK